MKHRNRVIAAMALGFSWTQPSLAVATYDLDGFFRFTNGGGLESGQLASNLDALEPVFFHEGNGEGSASYVPGLDTSIGLAAASGSAGDRPLAPLSASEISGEFVVDAAALFEQHEFPEVGFTPNIVLGISVSDPESSSASAGFEVLVFADDLLLANLSRMIDNSDLVDGTASFDTTGNLDPFRLPLGTQLFTVQYTLFGDSVSVNAFDVPEPRVAWLTVAGLLVAGAGRWLRPSARTV